MSLDLQVVAFLEAVKLANPPGWNEIGPVAGRERMASMGELFGTGDPSVASEDLTLGLDRKGQQVQIRIYRPSDSTDKVLPVILYAHGGGWVLGDLNTHDALCRNLVAGSGAALIAIDYSRSPEARYPVAIEECLGVMQSLSSGTEFEGLDSSRIALFGDSAGANLMLATALRLRDLGETLPCGILLAYPVVTPNFESESYRDFAEGYGLTKVAMQWFWEQYLGYQVENTAGPIPADADFASADLSNLPPIEVIIAGYDVLRDDGRLLVSRIRDAGGRVNHIEAPGMIHGFIHTASVFDEGVRMNQQIAERVKKIFAAGGEGDLASCP